MHEKRAIYRGCDDRGAPYTHRIEPGSGYGMSETSGVKSASIEHMPEVRTLVESIRPKPDTLYILNSAIVAGERTGFNARGDWFTEEGLRNEPDGWRDLPWTVDAVERRRKLALNKRGVNGWGSLAWGYPTFMNAHRYMHHVNLDPMKARGFVLGAFYDTRMSRVILVSELVKTLCVANGVESADIYDRIASGHFPDTSMACRVPYDVCSICGFVARIPADYCIHARTQMKAILPDGRKVGVYNHYPDFFDDSFVFVGAERAAKMMMHFRNLSGKLDYSRQTYTSRTGLALPQIRYASDDPEVYMPRQGKTAPPDTAYARAMAAIEKQADALVGGTLALNPTSDQLSSRADLYAPGIIESVRDLIRPQKNIGERAAVSRTLSEIQQGRAVQNKESAFKKFVQRKMSWLAAERDGRQKAEDRKTWERRARDELREVYRVLDSDIDAEELRIYADLRQRYGGTAKADTGALPIPAGTGQDLVTPGKDPLLLGKRASEKRGEIIKRLPPAHSVELDAVSGLEPLLPTLPTGALDALADAGPIGPSIALRVGILLSPREWQYTQVRKNLPGLAADILSRGATFPDIEPISYGRMDPLPADCIDISSDPACDMLLSLLFPHMKERSLCSAEIGKKLRACAFMDHDPIASNSDGCGWAGTNMIRTERHKLYQDAYAAYRRAALADLLPLRYLWSSADRPTISDPEVSLWRHLWTTR